MHPNVLTIIQQLCRMKQKHTKYTQINTNKSTHSEMGPPTHISPLVNDLYTVLVDVFIGRGIHWYWYSSLLVFISLSKAVKQYIGIPRSLSDILTLLLRDHMHLSEMCYHYTMVALCNIWCESVRSTLATGDLRRLAFMMAMRDFSSGSGM